jgi:hypothetical protein
MPDYEAAMLVYAKLAGMAHAKGQALGRDKFLLLAGLAACRAGWPDVAEECRTLVLRHNPRHLVSRFASLPDALRSAEFTAFDKQLTRWCPYEKAEHLLRQLNVTAQAPAADECTAGEIARTHLAAVTDGGPRASAPDN